MYLVRLQKGTAELKGVLPLIKIKNTKYEYNLGYKISTKKVAIAKFLVLRFISNVSDC